MVVEWVGAVKGAGTGAPSEQSLTSWWLNPSTHLRVYVGRDKRWGTFGAIPLLHKQYPNIWDNVNSRSTVGFQARMYVDAHRYDLTLVEKTGGGHSHKCPDAGQGNASGENPPEGKPGFGAVAHRLPWDRP